MAKYRKVDPRIWNDAKFSSMTDQGKLAFLFVMTHPHMTAVGAMRATMSGLAEELGWEKKDFVKAFGEGLSKRMYKHDPKACFVSLPRFVKYNRPENPNVVTGWSKAWDLVPECSLKTELYHSLKESTEVLGESFGKAFSEAFEAPLPKQEQEQEQEQEVKPNGASGDAPKGYPEDFEALWGSRPRRDGGDSKRDAFKAYRARLREGHTHEEIAKGMSRYREWLEAKGKIGTEFVKQTATFLGPAKHFQESWGTSTANTDGEMNFAGCL